MLDWRDQMNIDHGELDSDHQEQHDLIRRFVQTPGTEEERGPALKLLYELRQHSALHFLREEEVQETTAFPQMAEHKAQHRRLLDMLEELVEQIEARESPFHYHYVKDKANEVLQFWFFSHFVRADLKLRAHLAKCPRRQARRATDPCASCC